MDPVTIALSLAQFAPSIMRFFGVGEKPAAVAEKVVQLAQQVTGKTAPEEAVTALRADPALAQQFNLAVLAADTDLQKAYLHDTQDARARDVKLQELGYRNSRANTMLAGAGLLVVAILFVAIWQSPLDEFVKGILTLILGRCLGYIDQGFNFEFGTTRSSGKKDDTISQLAAK